MTPLGENLIFLISQPRAGSTLLQRLLGSHSEIHTVSEPWLMLHPLYAMRETGYSAEYNERVARSAVLNFLETLPNTQDEYFRAVSRMYSYLYETSLAASGKQYFLDKTPRYFLIIPELVRTFPRAKFILLFRNPLAVFSSILHTWAMADLLQLGYYAKDIIDAPSLLIQGNSHLKGKCALVHYERLVEAPHTELQRIFEWLGIASSNGVLADLGKSLPRWPLGDQKIYLTSGEAEGSDNKWLTQLQDPQKWRLTYDYFEWLGKNTLEEMGYSYHQLGQELKARRPSAARLWFTVSLGYVMAKPPPERNIVVRYFFRLMGALCRRGLIATTIVLTRKTLAALSGRKLAAIPFVRWSR